VISFERWKDGFIVTVEGRRMIAHCTASPSIYIGRPREKAGSSADLKGKAGAPLSWSGIGPCSVVNEGPDTIVLRFSPSLALRITYTERVLRITPKTADPGMKSLRILFGASLREKIFGVGPSNHYNLKAKEIEIDPEGDTGLREREPVVFSSTGAWMYVDGSGTLRWSFDPSRTVLFCSELPREIALGFGKTQAAAMELLSRYRASRLREGGVPGLRRPIPKQLQAGVIGDEWKEIAADSSVFSLPTLVDGPDGAAGLARKILSLSFSGVGHVFMPVSGTMCERTGSAEASAIGGLLDLAMFSPLFVVDPDLRKEDGAPRRGFARAAAVYGALAPYRAFCSEWWVREGIPAFCHPALYYPGETALWKLDDQFMFGPDMMIAPVLAGGRQSRRLCLPDDSWVHMWTSRHYSKGAAVVDVTAGKPAAFYREDSAFARLFDTVRQMATRL